MLSTSNGTPSAHACQVVCRQQLGDLLLHEPAIGWLARQYGAPVMVRARAALAPLVALMPHAASTATAIPPIRHSFCFDAKLASAWRTLAPPGTHRVLVAPAKKIHWLHRWLFAETHPFAKGDRYTALALYEAVGGMPAAFAPPRLNMPPADWLPADMPEIYGVVHPASAWQKKSWSADRWIAALAALQLPYPLVLTAGPAAWEVELCRSIAAGLRQAGGRAVDCAGMTSLRQYLALLSRSRLTLCVDGSASHVSAAFARPTFTLFGPTHPVHWHWPAAHARYLSARDFSAASYPPADAIPPAAVAAAIRAFLAEQPP